MSIQSSKSDKRVNQAMVKLVEKEVSMLFEKTAEAQRAWGRNCALEYVNAILLQRCGQAEEERDQLKAQLASKEKILSDCEARLNDTRQLFIDTGKEVRTLKAHLEERANFIHERDRHIDQLRSERNDANAQLDEAKGELSYLKTSRQALVKALRNMLELLGYRYFSVDCKFSEEEWAKINDARQAIDKALALCEGNKP